MSIHIKESHKGKLHADTGTPEGKKIPERKIRKALHSRSGKVRARARFAENARHWNHKRGSRKSRRP